MYYGRVFRGTLVVEEKKKEESVKTFLERWKGCFGEDEGTTKMLALFDGRAGMLDWQLSVDALLWASYSTLASTWLEERVLSFFHSPKVRAQFKLAITYEDASRRRRRPSR